MTDNGGSKIWYSRLQYRHNPADESQGVIDLGVALEFTTPQYWVVGLGVIAAIDDALLAPLDELTRKLLENRMAVMTREVQQALSKALRLGDVLKAVAARNPWSIYVEAPQAMKLTASEQKASDKVSTEMLTEQYVYKVLDVTREKLKGSVHDDDQGQVAEIPWIISPKSFIIPRSVREPNKARHAP